jgi:plastocyanin
MTFLSSLVLAAAVGITPARTAIHTVNQSNLTFSPASVNVVEGDTVRWVWTSLSHTVTNGTGSADPQVGALFDAPLNSVTPTFQYVFTTAGTFPYFCRPHEGFGMKGTIVVDIATDVRSPRASAVTLQQNYPNPFGGQTEIAYSLARESPVMLRVYDARGALVATLVSGQRPGGPHRVGWDGRDSAGRPAPNGVYFYRLESGATTVVRKLVVIR